MPNNARYIVTALAPDGKRWPNATPPVHYTENPTPFRWKPNALDYVRHLLSHGLTVLIVPIPKHLKGTVSANKVVV